MLQLMLDEQDVPIIAKRLAAWDEVYFGTLGVLAQQYSDPVAMLPKHLLPHPRSTRLIVNPVGCVALTYRADTPSFVSEWSRDSFEELLREPFFLLGEAIGGGDDLETCTHPD